MLCVPKETNKTVVFVRVPNFDEILKLEKIAKSVLGRNLSALEHMDDYTFDLTVEVMENLYNPFITKPISPNPHYLLIEISSISDIDQIQQQLFEEIESNIDY